MLQQHIIIFYYIYQINKNVLIIQSLVLSPHLCFPLLLFFHHHSHSPHHTLLPLLFPPYLHPSFLHLFPISSHMLLIFVIQSLHFHIRHIFLHFWLFSFSLVPLLFFPICIYILYYLVIKYRRIYFYSLKYISQICSVT